MIETIGGARSERKPNPFEKTGEFLELHLSYFMGHGPRPYTKWLKLSSKTDSHMMSHEK